MSTNYRVRIPDGSFSVNECICLAASITRQSVYENWGEDIISFMKKSREFVIEQSPDCVVTQGTGSGCDSIKIKSGQMTRF